MKKLFILLSLFTAINAQSTWAYSNRVHPELEWQTISTKHFNVHYHQGIEDIAKRGAILAEHYRPTLLAQILLMQYLKRQICQTQSGLMVKNVL